MKKLSVLIAAIMVLSLLATACAASSTGSNKIIQQQTVLEQSDAAYDSTGAIQHSLGLDTPAPVQAARQIASGIGGSAPATYAVPGTATSGSSGTQKQPAPDTNYTTASSAPDITRMIIRTGNISMVVNDIGETIDRITGLAEGMGGFVVSSNRSSSGKTLSGTISVRVPAGQFDSVISTLRSYAVKVTDDTNSAQDVTQEYIDLTARLKNLEAAEAQLTEIMKKATTVVDVLAVQNQLTATRADIESTKGRIQYLQQTSAMSLITATLNQAAMEITLVAGTRVARSGDQVGFGVQVYGGIPPYSYAWDFGDGTTSLEARPWHRYTSAGNYTVSVTVTDDRVNKATDRRENYISISPGWNAADVSKSAWRGLVGFGRFMGSFVIWLGIFSPVWIIAGGITFWLVRRRRQKKARLAAAQTAQPGTPA